MVLVLLKRTCKYSGLGHVLADSVVKIRCQLPVYALHALLTITFEYEASTDSISENETGISYRKLQKFTKIINWLLETS